MVKVEQESLVSQPLSPEFIPGQTSEYRIYMNRLYDIEPQISSNNTIDNSQGEYYEITDEDIEKLKLSIPHAKTEDVYKPQSKLKSLLTNKPTYLFERMTGNTELHGDEDFTSIKILNLSQIERLK